jgi:hypothetical protein
MICWLENSGNDVGSNFQHHYLLSSVSSRNSGYYTYKINFRDTLALHIARSSGIIKNNFMLHDDVYLIPKERKKK